MRSLFNRIVWYIEHGIPLPIWIVDAVQEYSFAHGCNDKDYALQFFLYNHTESVRFGVIRKSEVVNALVKNAKFAVRTEGLSGNASFLDLLFCGDSLNNIAHSLVSVPLPLVLGSPDLTALKGHPQQKEILQLLQKLGLKFDETPFVADAIKFFDQDPELDFIPPLEWVENFLNRYYEHPQEMDPDIKNNFLQFYNELDEEKEASYLLNIFYFAPILLEGRQTRVLRQIYLRQDEREDYCAMVRNLADNPAKLVIPKLFDKAISALENEEACNLVGEILSYLLSNDSESLEDKDLFLSFLQEIKQLDSAQIKQIFSAKSLSGSVVLINFAEKYPIDFLAFFREMKDNLNNAELLFLLSAENKQGKSLMRILAELPFEYFNLLAFYQDEIRTRLTQQEKKQFLLHRSSNGECLMKIAARNPKINFMQFFCEVIEEGLSQVYSSEEIFADLYRFDNAGDSVLFALLAQDFEKFQQFYLYLKPFISPAQLRKCWLEENHGNVNLAAEIASKHCLKFIQFYNEEIKPLFARRENYYQSRLDAPQDSVENIKELRNLLLKTSHTGSVVTKILFNNPQNFISFYYDEVRNFLFDKEFTYLMLVEADEVHDNVLAYLAQYDLENFMYFYQNEVKPRFTKEGASEMLKDLIKHTNIRNENLLMIIAEGDSGCFYEFFDEYTRSLFETDEELRQLYCTEDIDGNTIISYLIQDERAFTKALTDFTNMARKNIIIWEEVEGTASTALPLSMRKILLESELPQANELRDVLLQDFFRRKEERQAQDVSYHTLRPGSEALFNGHPRSSLNDGMGY